MHPKGAPSKSTWAPSGCDCCYVSLITGELGRVLSSLGTTPIIVAPGSQLHHVTQMSFSVYFSFIPSCPFGDVLVKIQGYLKDANDANQDQDRGDFFFKCVFKPLTGPKH